MAYQYYMFHKPGDCITANHDQRHKTVLDYFPEKQRNLLRPVGRLDLDTEGLLFLTDDGKWNQQIIHPDYHIPKTYFFWALGSLDETKKALLAQGVLLRGSDTLSAPAKLTILEVSSLPEILSCVNLKRKPGIMKNPANQEVVSGLLTITEGKKHQVKRMLKAVGCYVVYLKRISIGSVSLDETLAPGQYRELTKQEIKAFLPD